MDQPNRKNRTIFTGDNLPLMRGMNSESVDLVYLDPPFNSKRDYEAPIGSQAAGAAFKDSWALSDVDIAEHGRLAESNPICGSGTTLVAAEIPGRQWIGIDIEEKARKLVISRLQQAADSGAFPAVPHQSI